MKLHCLPIMNIAMRGDSDIVPAQSKALFIIDFATIDGNTVTDVKNGKIFTITDKDFTAQYFPYKSAATIAAPVGDAELFAADVNSFLYGVDANSPNQIPVVSLYQNIDYENKFFSLHVAQTVDANGVETIEPHVKMFVGYSSELSGSDLTACNTYYSVPTEQTSNVQWVAKDGNDLTGDGSKALPWLTIVKAHTEANGTDRVYIKTGVYPETIQDLLNVNLYGLGRVEQNPASYCMRQSGDPTVSCKHIYFNSSGTICIRSNVDYAGAWIFDSCWIAATESAFYNTIATTGTLTLNNCIIDERVRWYSSVINFDTILYNSNSGTNNFNTIFNSTNSKYNAGVGPTGMISIVGTGFDINFLGDEINNTSIANTVIAHDGDIDFEYCTFAVSGSLAGYGNFTGDVNITYDGCTFVSDGTNGTMINVEGGTGDYVFSNNTVTNMKGAISFKGTLVTQTFECKSNTFTNALTDEQKIKSESLVSTIEDNLCYGGTSAIQVLNDLATAQISTIKGNVLVSYADSPSSPFIHVGTEGDVSTYGKSNGSVISENVCYGPYLIGGDPGGQHGVFIYAQDVDFKYNKVFGTSLGVVVKSAGESYNTKLYSNLISDCAAAFTIKGAVGVYIYGNTVVTTSVMNGIETRGLQQLADELYVDSESTGLLFKNNIIADFRTADDWEFFDSTTEDMVDSEYDYNIYYKVYGTAFATWNSPATITFAAWQALSQDVNSSQVDPEFTDSDNEDYSITSESNAAGAGETLAADYDDSLDASTDWGDSSTLPVIVTKQQTAPWDCGAYVS